MRTIKAADIADAVEKLALDAAFSLGTREIKALEDALQRETSPHGRDVISTIIENNTVASGAMLPLCQDCGSAVVWIERGDGAAVDGCIEDAVNTGVRRAYEKGYLRKSILRGGLDRVNTGDNTPAFIRCECVPGDVFRIRFAAKGGGSENAGALRMLTPADGRDGVVDFVVDTVRRSGGRPCPPVILGVGIGGNFEGVAMLAKKALFRPLGDPNPDVRLARIEEDIFRSVNALGIGPMGLGGKVTALAVHVEEAACHMASLPVAVNVECHSHRHREMSL
ncbi:MAG: fumarate hydratase [Planctomycetes bacterium]|nr:fumarate hydratase [Planctomycetota bacterium]